MTRRTVVYVVVSGMVVLLIGLYLMTHTLRINQAPILQAPHWQHLLGTDQLGRDVLMRLIVGSGVTLGLTIIVIMLSVLSGLLLGLLAGVEGRYFDKCCMFIADLLQVIPSFIIALVVFSFLSDSMVGLMLALTVGWTGRYLRYFRNLTRDIKTRPFIQYDVLNGNSKIQTMMTLIVPNLLNDIFALITADIGKMMLSISGLAFLGLGIKPPTPELGTILFEGKSYFNSAPWLFFFPGLLLGGYALLFQQLNKKLVKQRLY